MPYLFSRVNYSPRIDAAIETARKEGTLVLEIVGGYSKVKEVIFMDRPMTDACRTELKRMEGLDYWEDSGSPHEKPGEGFVDSEYKVAISFPAR